MVDMSPYTATEHKCSIDVIAGLGASCCGTSQAGNLPCVLVQSMSWQRCSPCMRAAGYRLELMERTGMRHVPGDLRFGAECAK